MSETKPAYELHTPAPHVTRFVCRTCGLGVENTIDGDCERCYANTLSRPLAPRPQKLLAYPQPTNYLQDVMDGTVAVRVDEPSLERIRALVEETVRRVLQEKDDGMTEQALIEQLADREHDSWARWQAYLFSKCNRNEKGELVIPESLIWRWQRQIDTPYAELSETEKQSDRNEVAHILPIIHAFKEHV